MMVEQGKKTLRAQFQVSAPTSASSSTALLLFAFSDAKSSTQEFLKSSLHSGPETCLSDESPLGPLSS